MEKSEKAKALTELFIKALCRRPDNVRIDVTQDEKGILFTVGGIDSSDMGSVIGRAGAHARALRTIVRAIGWKEMAIISIKISEPEGSTYSV